MTPSAPEPSSKEAGTPLSLLLVEDFAEDAELLVHELRRGGFDVTFERVQTAAAFEEALARREWQVVISDYDLPAFSGPAALRILQATGLDVPFIMISGTIGEEIAVSSLKAGAHDFLIKGRLARLVPAIERERREVDVRRERARAQNSLRRSEARYRSLIDGAVLGIYQATAEGEFVTVNPALVAMLGYESPAELLRIGWADLHDDPKVAHAVIPRASEQGYFAGEEVIWRRKNGEPIRVRLSGRLIEDADGGRTLSEVFVEDVTEPHRLQEQLRQAQKMEAVGQLAGGVAHDFNNILGVILMQAELAEMVGGTPEKVREGLVEIRAAAERAANLTRQLLLFSRQQVMQQQQVDLNEVVTDLASMLRRVIREDVTLELHLHSGSLLTYADAGMLGQLLMNLAVNARDAMPAGGRLVIETAEKMVDADETALNPDALPGRYVWLSVSDTGGGIPPEILPRIFEPFFTTKEVGKGTGLGLATVFGVVKQHRGWLKVYSEVGKGTNFQIFLPAMEAPGKALAQAAVKARPRGGSETILVAEDNALLRMVTRAALGQAGYEVLEAADGVEAERIWSEHQGRIALLWTDLVMPGGLNGRELAARLQKQKPGLKVIFTSGYSAEIAGRELKLGASQVFLQKPCSREQLLEAVRNCLDS